MKSPDSPHLNDLDKPSNEGILSAREKFLGILPNTSILAGLTLALSIEAGCLSEHAVGDNDTLVKEDFIAKQCKTKVDGGAINYYRFGERGEVANCDAPASILAVPGVNSSGLTYALLAHELPKEQLNQFIAIDLPGQGGSDTFGLDVKTTNPVSIASHLREFVVKVFADQRNNVIIGHSTGGAISALLMNGLPNTKGILINPILAMEPKAVRNPSRIAPYLCKSELASYLVRKGAVAKLETGKKNGPGLFKLKSEEIQNTAEKTNICLVVEDEQGVQINEPCDNTPVQSLIRDMGDHCGPMKGLALSVRSEQGLSEWRDVASEAFRKNKNNITVILEETDSVLDSERTKEIIGEEYSGMEIVNVNTGGAHELPTTQPKVVAKFITDVAKQNSYKKKPEQKRPVRPNAPLAQIK